MVGRTMSYLRLRGRPLERPAWTTARKEVGHFVDFLERRGGIDRPRAQALADDIVAGMLLEIGDNYVSAMQGHMDGITRIRGDLARRYEGIIRHFEGRSGAVPMELPPDLQPAAFKAMFDELNTHLEALNTTAEAFTAKSLDTPAILSDLEGLRQAGPTEPPSGVEGMAGEPGPAGPSGGPPSSSGPPGPPDLPSRTLDMRRARNTLGRIYEDHKELLDAVPRLQQRFRDIANLASTDPAESARLATALERELAEAEGLAGGAVREITTTPRAEPRLPRADERYYQMVAGLEENRVFGQVAEEYGNQYLRRNFQGVADQVRIRPLLDNGQPADFYFIADNLATDPATGAVVAFDSKLSSSAPTTPNQAIGYPLLGRNGGIVESLGREGVGFPPGHPLPPTQVYKVQPLADLRFEPPATPDDFVLIPLN
jgi:hypothetical protein